jgi:uncharacterized membrane protein YfcA
MTDPLHLLILFLIGTASGFLNVMAGGGSAIVLPILIFMGLDSALANGTNRVAILLQNISAVASFRRREYLQLKESMTLSLFTLPGAIAGAVLAVRVSDETFQRILAVVMIGIIVSMFVSPTGRRDESDQSNNGRRKLIYPVMLAVGFYGGFIQVGVGFLFMASLYHLLKLNLVHVNMHKVFIVMVYTLPALVVFALTGNVNWFIGLVLGIGNAFGAWWAARASVEKGEKLIRVVLGVAILIMSLKLFSVF